MATESRARKPKRMEAVPADIARQKLGELIDRAAFKGERIPLNRNGKEPIVALVSIADLEKIEAA